MGASFIMASRCALGISPLWRPELERLTKYSEGEVEPCFEAIWACYSENFPTAPSAPTPSAKKGEEEENEKNVEKKVTP